MINKGELYQIVADVVEKTPVTDIHTHLFSAEFGDLMLLGVDELLTYHYLIAETLRISDVAYDEFWGLSKKEQADLIWQTLFIDNTPYSEACRGVVTVLQSLGVDLSTRNLDEYREQLGQIGQAEYVDMVFEKAGVANVVMTNDPFDTQEREIWLNNPDRDNRFLAALRIDPMLNDYDKTYKLLKSWGYAVDEKLGGESIAELQRFIREWIDRMNALYVAVSLPDTFQFPEDSTRARLIGEVILPVCREKNIPMALMIGVKRKVNPELKAAGDGVGKADIGAVERLCAMYPENKFMVTFLSRENQHELAVTARKFRNLMVFGCWWFLNNPSLIEEITAMRFELLGSSIIPQHSDCRILDQLIYKWRHSRKIITDVLVDKYSDLIDAGWVLTREDIARDAAKLFGGNFWEFLEKRL